MIAEHLSILPALVPLVAAPLCFILPAPRLCWAWACAAVLVSFALSLQLAYQALTGGTLSYAFGGWAPPWGIEFRVDAVNAFVLVAVNAVTAGVLVYARSSVADEVPRGLHAIFYTAWLLCLAGLNGILLTGDAFNLFVFLEISSLASYILISFGQDRRALTSAFQYLIMGTIGATFFLIGVGLMYSLTGTLNMQDLAERLPALSDSRTIKTAFAFIVVGVSLKLALFPLHLWLPNAYAFAPSAVSAFLAATATKVAVYVLLRFIFSVFGAEFAFQAMPLGLILMSLALAGIVIASLTAITEDNLKRVLAYSSVAQIGYMILGASLATPLGLTAGLVHIFNHALMKGALFMALGAIIYRTGAQKIGQIEGVAASMPWTMAAFLVGGASLVGVPLTAGFVSKWYLVLAAVELGWWPLVAVVLAGSLLALVYLGRIVEAAYFRADKSGAGGEAPLALLLPTWVLALANIWFGVNTGLTVGVAREGARVLLEGSP